MEHEVYTSADLTEGTTEEWNHKSSSFLPLLSFCNPLSPPSSAPESQVIFAGLVGINYA